MSGWDDDVFVIAGVPHPAVDVIRQMDTGVFDFVNQCFPNMIKDAQDFYERYCAEHLAVLGVPFVFTAIQAEGEGDDPDYVMVDVTADPFAEEA